MCQLTRSELIDEVAAAYPELDRDVIERVVETIFEEISHSLENGGKVELRGFGSFFVKMQVGRLARNPKTGKTVQISQRHIPRFRAGKQLRDQMNNRV